MSQLTFANRSNVDLVDANYAKWRADAGSVDAEWRAFFEGFELASTQPKAAKGAQEIWPARGPETFPVQQALIREIFESPAG